MLIPRFSTDSYSVYFYTSDGLNGFLELGRIGTFLLYKVLLAFGINSVTLSPLFTAVLCLAVTWSAAVVLYLLKLCFTSLNRLTALSFVCLCASLSFYQAALGMFMILGSLLILVRHDVLWPQAEGHGAGPVLRELLRLAAVGGGASVVNVLTTRLLAMAGFYSDRAPSSDLGGILDSVRQTVQQFNTYYPWGYPNYLPGVLKMVFILAGPVLLYLLADSFDKHSRERYPLSSVLVTLAVLVAGFLLVFAPHLVANSVWMPPRSIFSFLPCSRLWLSSQAITMSAMGNRSRWLSRSSCWSCSPPTSW